MHLRSLQLVHFKNYEELEIELNPFINCFVGPNGSGKTNVLDAIYYLSMCRSYLNPVDRQNVGFGKPFFMIHGHFFKAEKQLSVQCHYKPGSKKIFKKNKREYEKLSDHIGLLPAVMISPYDRDLIAEGSEVRRKWMDGIISQSSKTYLNLLQRYYKILEQRNALLKHQYENGFFDRESMEIWDEQLIETGVEIHSERKRFLAEFIPVFRHFYAFIGAEQESVDFSYKSQLNEADFRSVLEDLRRKDSLTQYTNGGVHKDDLVFTIQDHPVKKFGSQGQQKSYLIALRLAQFEWLKSHLKEKPLLLLDDIFDKLDQYRVEKLIQLVSEERFGQVFITDTDFSRMHHILERLQLDKSFFEVKTGVVNAFHPDKMTTT